MQIYSWYKQHTKPNLNLRLMEEPWHWPEAEEQAFYRDMKNQKAYTGLGKWTIYEKIVIKPW